VGDSFFVFAFVDAYDDAYDDARRGGDATGVVCILSRDALKSHAYCFIRAFD
jgi:hypothetical protein